MDKMTCQMTVLFEGAFWVGVFEKTEGNRLSVAKVTFGAEPKDLEVRDFILKHFYELKFSPEVKTQVKERKQNPKRAQREVKNNCSVLASGRSRNRRSVYIMKRTNKSVKKKTENKNASRKNGNLC